ncbi:hypothetical protein CVT26_011931 [Gymnopilus dilepis]|uniref:Uncharacterized protein n=1 Tax=Gymnopilus dilepis TaxID=231916 RepID=A0A409W942_9AGAR|nr:hypothetical protein CVT26_011931 [Gymnopilus dilepis]
MNRQPRRPASPYEDRRRLAPPPHRHAAPSAPWPWVDIDDKIDAAQLSSMHPPIPEPCNHESCDRCWKGYPRSLYPNWTPTQVLKSKIAHAIDKHRYDGLPCVIYQVDVDNCGFFKMPHPDRIISNYYCLDDTWRDILHSKASVPKMANLTFDAKVPEDNRIRALFVENMSGPVMQMLGTKYNIEPFFFSSTLNWIPCKYQEDIRPGFGDHVTLSLTFIRSVPISGAFGLNTVFPSPMSFEALHDAENTNQVISERMIDTQAPLLLSSQDRLLVLDLLSVHLIRRKQGSIIISCHADKELPTTTASFLQERIRFAGQSVYWQHIFQLSPDPTFLLLIFIWHAIYAWDEALENLYSHICFLESRVITTSEMPLTQELHVIRAHHLHHTSLLEDLRSSVRFVCETINPAMESLSDEERALNSQILSRECAHLSREIDRLEMESKMQDSRLKNVMNLVFSSVNIIDSRRMQSMTEAAVRDSAGEPLLKDCTLLMSCDGGQLTKFNGSDEADLIPNHASFVAAVFGMNVREIVPQTPNSVPIYIAVAIPFTLVTIWIITSFQSKFFFPSEQLNFWKKVLSPVLLIPRLFGKKPLEDKETRQIGMHEA